MSPRQKMCKEFQKFVKLVMLKKCKHISKIEVIGTFVKMGLKRLRYTEKNES